MSEQMHQQSMMWVGPAAEDLPLLGPEPADPVAARSPQQARQEVWRRPVHCGTPMAARGLAHGPAAESRNQAVLEAAVHGVRVYACACGFLTEVFAPGEQDPLVPAGEAHLFRALFARRVLAAAGQVETAQWALDQADPLPQPWESITGAEAATVESASWNLDQATAALAAELTLAAHHGLDLDALAAAAGMPAEEITPWLETSVTGDAAPAPTDNDGPGTDCTDNVSTEIVFTQGASGARRQASTLTAA